MSRICAANDLSRMRVYDASTPLHGIVHAMVHALYVTHIAVAAGFCRRSERRDHPSALHELPVGHRQHLVNLNSVMKAL